MIGGYENYKKLSALQWSPFALEFLANKIVLWNAMKQIWGKYKYLMK